MKTRKPTEGKNKTAADELQSRLNAARSTKTKIYTAGPETTEIVVDGDNELTYPHCILPEHFFERHLALGKSSASLSLEPWRGRTNPGNPRST